MFSVNHCRSGECHTSFFQCLYSKNSFQNGMFDTDQLLACHCSCACKHGQSGPYERSFEKDSNQNCTYAFPFKLIKSRCLA